MKKEINLTALKKAKNDLAKESEKLEALLKQKKSLDEKIDKQNKIIADKTEAKQGAELKLFGELASAAGLSIFGIVAAMQSGDFNSVTAKLKNSGIEKDVLNEIFELMKEQPKSKEEKDKNSSKQADDKASDTSDKDTKDDTEDKEDTEDKSVPPYSPAPNNGYQG